jgi:predicted nucleic acid-binding protein
MLIEPDQTRQWAGSPAQHSAGKDLGSSRAAVSACLRAFAPPERPASHRLARRSSALHLTTISLAELRYGIAALPAGARLRRLDHRFENEVLPIFEGRILPFDEDATVEYAALRATARAAGRAIGDLDALIAGIARTAGFAVATRNTAPCEAPAFGWSIRSGNRSVGEPGGLSVAPDKFTE